MGFRYRLHCKDLPGKPDIVFRRRQKIVFVHGCFWHQHPKSSCRDSRPTKSNTGYWREKLARNIERDKRVVRQLRKDGWRVLVVWECELKHTERLAQRLKDFLA